MIITYESYGKRELSEEEKKQLEIAKSMPIVFDEDCPPLTDEQLSQFKRVNKDRAAN